MYIHIYIYRRIDICNMQKHTHRYVIYIYIYMCVCAHVHTQTHLDIIYHSIYSSWRFLVAFRQVARRGRRWSQTRRCGGSRPGRRRRRFPGRNDEKWEDGDRFQWKLGSSLIMVNYSYSNIDWEWLLIGLYGKTINNRQSPKLVGLLLGCPH